MYGRAGRSIANARGLESTAATGSDSGSGSSSGKAIGETSRILLGYDATAGSHVCGTRRERRLVVNRLLHIGGKLVELLSRKVAVVDVSRHFGEDLRMGHGKGEVDVVGEDQKRAGENACQCQIIYVFRAG
jgi:hypothetical protein